MQGSSLRSLKQKPNLKFGTFGGTNPHTHPATGYGVRGTGCGGNGTKAVWWLTSPPPPQLVTCWRREEHRESWTRLSFFPGHNLYLPRPQDAAQVMWKPVRTAVGDQLTHKPHDYSV